MLVKTAMQLNARVLPLDPVTRARMVELLGAGRPATSARYAVPADDAALPRILAAGADGGGAWVSGEAVFSAGELASFTHFEAVCRYVVPESRADQATNAAEVERTPPLDAGGFAPIRLVRAFVLSRIRMKPNTIGAIGDWTGEFVSGAAPVRLLAAARFSGYALLAVGDGRGGTHAAHQHLYGEAILPPARIDCSVERIESSFPEEQGRLRHLGCLTYRASDLADRPDFNRTAEPWAGPWGWPAWVVSARVARRLREACVRGWAFRPVLAEGSAVHVEYLRRWEHLRALVAAAPASRLDGARW